MSKLIHFKIPEKMQVLKTVRNVPSVEKKKKKTFIWLMNSSLNWEWEELSRTLSCVSVLLQDLWQIKLFLRTSPFLSLLFCFDIHFQGCYYCLYEENWRLQHPHHIKKMTQPQTSNTKLLLSSQLLGFFWSIFSTKSREANGKAPSTRFWFRWNSEYKKQIHILIVLKQSSCQNWELSFNAC